MASPSPPESIYGGDDPCADGDEDKDEVDEGKDDGDDDRDEKKKNGDKQDAAAGENHKSKRE